MNYIFRQYSKEWTKVLNYYSLKLAEMVWQNKTFSGKYSSAVQKRNLCLNVAEATKYEHGMMVNNGDIPYVMRENFLYYIIRTEWPDFKKEFTVVKIV